MVKIETFFCLKLPVWLLKVSHIIFSPWTIVRNLSVSNVICNFIFLNMKKINQQRHTLSSILCLPSLLLSSLHQTCCWLMLQEIKRRKVTGFKAGTWPPAAATSRRRGTTQQRRTTGDLRWWFPGRSWRRRRRRRQEEASGWGQEVAAAAAGWEASANRSASSAPAATWRTSVQGAGRTSAVYQVEWYSYTCRNTHTCTQCFQMLPQVRHELTLQRRHVNNDNTLLFTAIRD